MSKINKNCTCPNNKCPNHGNCKDCIESHHKVLHTYCRAGKFEKFVRVVHAKFTN